MLGNIFYEVIIIMSYVAPQMRTHFESLSIDLKNEILKQDVQIQTMRDLINCLEKIVLET